MLNLIKEVLRKFVVRGELVSFTKNNIGLINNTFVITTTIEKYILQRINKSIFKNPDQLMENISMTTEHLRNDGYITLDIIKSQEGGLFTEFDGEFWRVLKYISGETIKEVDDIKIVSESSKQLAIFHNSMSNFPSNKLYKTISGFHNINIIYKNFYDTLLRSSTKDKLNCEEEISYIKSKEKDCQVISKLIEKKKIPIRVCHNDPKITNFLFDQHFNSICLIDLDTVMPGTLLIDISDAIRAICVSHNENEADIDKLHLKIDYFEEFISVYLKENNSMLNSYELDNIINSMELIFLEQGIRFLDDHLNGNNYFKVCSNEQNLVRAKNQLYFSKEVAENKNQLETIIKRSF